MSFDPADSWLARPLEQLTRWVLSAPKTVLLIAVVLAVASILLAVWGLGFRTSRLDLLNPASAYNQRWLAYLEEFGSQDDVVVVIEGEGRRPVVASVDTLVARLRQHPATFEDLLWSRDLSGMRPKALQFLELDELQQFERLLDRVEPVLEGEWYTLSAAAVLRQTAEAAARGGNTPPLGLEAPDPGAATAPLPADGVSRLADFLRDLARGLADAGHEPSQWEALGSAVGRLRGELAAEYLLEDEGRLGFVLLRFASRDEGLVQTGEPVRQLRGILDDIEQQHPDVSLGMTGMAILEHDEMTASTRDTMTAGMVSLVGVAIVFVAGFGSVRRPLLTVATLLVALAWSFGYITIGVGHLNILSVSFGVILIGLGIDFGIHYVAQYGQVLTRDGDRASSLVRTAGSVGPGIVTGGVTTALAFCTSALTDFTGVAELGLIAAGGIVLCIAAALIVLPGLLLYADTSRRSPARFGLPVQHLFAPFAKTPRTVLTVAVLGTALVAGGLGRLHYDHNLLNLQPAGLESVALQNRLDRRLGRGIWYAVSMADSRDELRDRKARFEALPVVVDTEEIVSRLPVATRERQQRILAIRARLADLPRQPPLIPVARFDMLYAAADQLRYAPEPLGAAAGTLADVMDDLPQASYFERLSAWQQASATQLLDHLHALFAMSDPVPVGVEDLPAAWRSRFVGRQGRHLLRVYGRPDIWDMDELEAFVQGLEGVDPRITGHPVQTYYASRQMQASYLEAALYSLLAVSAALMVDFRKIRYWLLAMVPMTLGMLQLFGLLGWLGIPLNPANLIVLPLILGIGVDDGVHVIHDYLRQRTRRYQLSNATATAIVLTSATTMIGFGSMMFATHRGLRSLGQVLTLGILCCLISSLVVLPPLLRWCGGAFSTEPRTDKMDRLDTGADPPVSHT